MVYFEKWPTQFYIKFILKIDSFNGLCPIVFIFEFEQVFDFWQEGQYQPKFIFSDNFEQDKYISSWKISVTTVL